MWIDRTYLRLVSFQRDRGLVNESLKHYLMLLFFPPGWNESRQRGQEPPDETGRSPEVGQKRSGTCSG